MSSCVVEEADFGNVLTPSSENSRAVMCKPLRISTIVGFLWVFVNYESKLFYKPMNLFVLCRVFPFTHTPLLREYGV